MADDQPDTDGIGRRKYLATTTAFALAAPATTATARGMQVADEITDLDGGETISEPGRYVLEDDLEVEPLDVSPGEINEEGQSLADFLPDETGITVEADNVTIDGQGATITGPLVGEPLVPEEQDPVAEADVAPPTPGIASAIAGETATTAVSRIGGLVQQPQALAAISVQDARDLSVERLDLRRFRTGIVLNRVVNSSVNNTDVSQTGGFGLRIDQSRSISVSNSTFNENIAGGINVVRSRDITISQTNTNTNDGYGILVGQADDTSRDIILESTTANGNGLAGVFFLECTESSFAGTANGNLAGVLVQGRIDETIDRGIQIAGVACNDNTEVGIRIDNANGTDVVDNTLSNNQTAIDIAGDRNSVIANSVTGGVTGIRIRPGIRPNGTRSLSQGNEITGRNVVEVRGIGVALDGPGQFNRVSGLTCRESGLGISANGQDRLELGPDNEIVESRGTGISVFRSNGQIVGNTVTNSSFTGLVVGRNTSDLNIEDNDCNLNNIGLVVRDSGQGVTVFNNRANQNTGGGMVFRQSSLPPIQSNVANDNGGSGYLLEGLVGAEFSGNEGNDNGGFGINLINTVNSSITGNTFLRNVNGPFPVARAANNTIANNTI